MKNHWHWNRTGVSGTVMSSVSELAEQRICQNKAMAVFLHRRWCIMNNGLVAGLREVWPRHSGHLIVVLSEFFQEKTFL